MTDYNLIIKEKMEDTDFDGKTIPYKRETHFDFLKDIMAMANADIDTDRYIVIGIDTHPGQTRLIGIDKQEFKDPADYQELLRENIEPDIDLRYFHHDCDGKTYGIFEISNCNNPPYMMKKDYPRKVQIDSNNKKPDLLVKGDAWIRKGSHNTRMIRNDFEQIYEKKLKKSGFRGELKLFFSDTDSDILHLSTVDEMILPSKRDYELISKIITEKKRQKGNKSESINQFFITIRFLFERFTSPHSGKYRSKDLNGLEKIRDEIKENFSEDDYFELFGLRANRINITIENLGNEYLEDASIKFIIPQIEGIAISDHESHRSKRENRLILPNPFNYYIKQLSDFPNVIYYHNKIEIPVHIGDIEHRIPKKVFPEPLRIVLNKSMVGKTIEIDCIIYGKNLREPQYKKLKIQAYL